MTIEVSYHQYNIFGEFKINVKVVLQLVLVIYRSQDFPTIELLYPDSHVSSKIFGNAFPSALWILNLILQTVSLMSSAYSTLKFHQEVTFYL